MSYFETKQKKPITNDTETDFILETTSCTTNNLSLLSLTLVDVLMRTVIPCLGMFAANVILIYKLRRIRGERWSKRETMFTRSVVALNTFYVVSQIPGVCTWVYEKMLLYQDDDTSDQLINEHIITQYVFSACLLLTSLTYVFPTVVYFVFNRLFRQEIFLILRIRSDSRTD